MTRRKTISQFHHLSDSSLMSQRERKSTSRLQQPPIESCSCPQCRNEKFHKAGIRYLVTALQSSVFYAEPADTVSLTRAHIPTNIGVWRISLNSPVTPELERINDKVGKLAYVALTVAKTGKDKDTRCSIVKMVLPSQRKHEPPPRNQRMLDLEDLTESQKEQLQQILKHNQSQSDNSSTEQS